MSRHSFPHPTDKEKIVCYGYDRPLQGYFVEVETLSEDEVEIIAGSNIMLASGLNEKVKSNGDIVKALLELKPHNFNCPGSTSIMAEVFDDALHDHQESLTNLNNCIECNSPCRYDFCSSECYNKNQI